MLRQKAKIIARRDVAHLAERGHCFGPIIAEVPTPDFLEQEVFGPILHIHRYDPANLEEVAQRIGAVVGVQPFGGEGLSGTGSKAGGPHSLLRYAVKRAISVNIAAQGGDPALLNL